VLDSSVKLTTYKSLMSLKLLVLGSKRYCNMFGKSCV